MPFQGQENAGMAVNAGMPNIEFGDDPKACEFERAVKNFNGADPIPLWKQYIDYVAQKYTDNISQRKTLLRRCLLTYYTNPDFAGNSTYLTLWVEYAQLLPREKRPIVFEKLRRRSIGKRVALFYLAYSAVCEQDGDLDKASQILQDGLTVEAKPTDQIMQAFMALLKRKTSTTNSQSAPVHSVSSTEQKGYDPALLQHPDTKVELQFEEARAMSMASTAADQPKKRRALQPLASRPMVATPVQALEAPSPQPVDDLGAFLEAAPKTVQTPQAARFDEAVGQVTPSEPVTRRTQQAIEEAQGMFFDTPQLSRARNMDYDEDEDTDTAPAAAVKPVAPAPQFSVFCDDKMQIDDKPPVPVFTDENAVPGGPNPERGALSSIRPPVPTNSASSGTSVLQGPIRGAPMHEEEEEEDDFAQRSNVLATPAAPLQAIMETSLEVSPDALNSTFASTVSSIPETPAPQSGMSSTLVTPATAPAAARKTPVATVNGPVVNAPDANARRQLLQAAGVATLGVVDMESKDEDSAVDMADVEDGLEIGDHFFINVESHGVRHTDLGKVTVLSGNDMEASDDAPPHLVQIGAPDNLWELFISHQIKQVLPQPTGKEFLLLMHKALVFSDISVLLGSVPGHPSLKVLQTAYASQKQEVPELLVLYLAVELMNSVNKLHHAGFVHGAISPDAVCLREFNDVELGRWNKERKDGWDYRGVQLRHWDCAVATKTLGSNGRFVGRLTESKSEWQRCPLMQQGKPWRLEVDTYGIANTLHFLMCGRQLPNSAGAPRIAATWNEPLWLHIFDTLLGAVDASTLGDLESFAAEYIGESVERMTAMKSFWGMGLCTCSKHLRSQ